MKYWLRKFALICLLLLCFILLLSETVYFTAKIFNMHILSMGLYINVCSGVFRTQSNIYGGASLQKSQESFIVDVGLGSNYASGIGFTVENVHTMPIFIYLVWSKSTSKIYHCLLVSWVNKKLLGLTRSCRRSLSKKTQSIDLLWKWMD